MIKQLTNLCILCSYKKFPRHNILRPPKVCGSVCHQPPPPQGTPGCQLSNEYNEEVYFAAGAVPMRLAAMSWCIVAISNDRALLEVAMVVYTRC